MQGKKLPLNVPKSKSMLIGTKRAHINLNCANRELSLKIFRSEQEVVEKITHIGVQVANSLDWKEHIKVASSKASKALMHAKRILPVANLETLYFSIVEPQFIYCCSVWHRSGSTTRSQLQRLQNRAARIATNGGYDDPGGFLIKSLDWKINHQLISLDSKLMAIKSVNTQATQYLCNLFSRSFESTSRNLRNTSTTTLGYE